MGNASADKFRSRSSYIAYVRDCERRHFAKQLLHAQEHYGLRPRSSSLYLSFYLPLFFSLSLSHPHLYRITVSLAQDNPTDYVMLKYLSGCIRETWALSMHGSAARGIAIPFAPSPFPPLLHPPTSLALRLSLRSSLTSTPCPLGHHVGGIGIRSLSFPPFSSFFLIAIPRADTRTRRPGAHREPETKFSATSPPSMLPITRCSRDEIERPWRFSAPAATILRWIWKDKIGQVRR